MVVATTWAILSRTVFVDCKMIGLKEDLEHTPRIYMYIHFLMLDIVASSCSMDHVDQGNEIQRFLIVTGPLIFHQKCDLG